MKKFTTILTLLLLAATTASAQWAGKGTGIYKNGQWYALYETSESNFSTISSKDYNLQAPGASLTFDVKCVAILGIWGGPLRVAEYVNDAWNNDLYSYNCANKNTYYTSDVVYLNHNATKISLYTKVGATGKKYFKNVFVPMAQYIYAPSETALDFGSADKGESASRTFTVAWCNVPGFSWTVTGANADDVEVSIDENAQAGSYNTSTVTVKYNRAVGGDLDAVLTITNGYDNYSHDIQLSGTSVESTVTAKMRINAEAKWGTFCAPFDVVLPEGVQAYTGEIQSNGGWIKMTEVEGTVPANTAVVVYAQELAETTEWPFTSVPVTTEGMESCFTPNLTGADMDIEAGNYLLQNNYNAEKQTKVVGWYLITGNGFKLAPYRCYLAPADNARSFIGIDATDGDATGINSIASEAGAKTDGKYMVNGQVVIVKEGKAYNMNGQQL
ncbi:MAG: hypothetical protein J5630_02580 [Bacteroidaceae bacterium]|nr:hypothetical protein [Bacteroidaceae bacterium]